LPETRIEVGFFCVRLSLVGLRHARIGQLVQGAAKGDPDERGTPARPGRGDAFELARQRLVQLYY